MNTSLDARVYINRGFHLTENRNRRFKWHQFAWGAYRKSIKGSSNKTQKVMNIYT